MPVWLYQELVNLVENNHPKLYDLHASTQFDSSVCPECQAGSAVLLLQFKQQGRARMIAVLPLFLLLACQAVAECPHPDYLGILVFHSQYLVFWLLVMDQSSSNTAHYGDISGELI